MSTVTCVSTLSGTHFLLIHHSSGTHSHLRSSTQNHSRLNSMPITTVEVFCPFTVCIRKHCLGCPMFISVFMYMLYVVWLGNALSAWHIPCWINLFKFKFKVACYLAPTLFPMSTWWQEACGMCQYGEKWRSTNIGDAMETWQHCRLTLCDQRW